MNLRSLRKHWDAFGRRDPLWAILTQPDKQGSRWDVREFFETGVHEIAAVLSYLESIGVAAARGRALDFGCGVGRLTQALAAHFDQVVGVDIAPSMIEGAMRHNTAGSRCRFVLNETDDLQCFGDGAFDFVYSNIVLQHIEPRFSRRYLQEFLRTLAPGGVLVFQLPSHPIPQAEPGRRWLRARVPAPVRAGYRRVRRWFEFPRMEGYGMPRTDVVSLLDGAGGRVVDVQPDESAGPRWVSFRYCVMKERSSA